MRLFSGILMALMVCSLAFPLIRLTSIFAGIVGI